MTPEQIGELYRLLREETARHSITRGGIDIPHYLPDEAIATMTAAAIKAASIEKAIEKAAEKIRAAIEEWS